ncbi:hypothetical protein F5Y01DRAFT_322611 [Xylaria sp. FL0043]|nr:hypothetical protein F5Y01DRAFT_322611 [Xylaria sp. FL0043]
MATEASPEAPQTQPSASQFDSQNTDLIEQHFLAPLEDSQETNTSSNQHHDNDLDPDSLAPLKDSQETQTATPAWLNASRSHQANMRSQPLQPTKGPFISRPLPEDPVDFQNGFQYSRAPVPHFQPVPLKTPRERVALGSKPKNDGSVESEVPSRTVGSHTSDSVSNDSKNINWVEAKGNEQAPKTEPKTYDPIPISSDPPSDQTMDAHEQPHKSSLRDTATGLPSLNASPLNKVSGPFQQPKPNIRSPATKLETPRLPKAFEDIRRKALIQSNRTNCPSQSVHHSNSRINKASVRLNTSELHQKVPQNHAVSSISTIQDQERPSRCPNSYRNPRTPETKGPGRKVPKGRSDAEQLTSPVTQEAGKHYKEFTRPVSEASNISRIRTPLREERARIQGRRAKLELKESKTRRNRLIRSWNDFFMYEADRNEYWEAKVDDMIQQLAERDNRVAEFLEQIQEQEQVIEDLEIEKQQHYAARQEQEDALAKSEEQRQRLRGRMKEFKDRLNDATIEQQKLFKYFQPRYHELREQMKQAELEHQDLLQKALSTTNQINGNIQASVKQVRALSEQEIQKLCLKIGTLEAELAERKKDVDRERDHNNDLRRDLDSSHELNKVSLETLYTQNQELLNRSDESNIQIQSVKQSMEQQEGRIQSLQGCIDKNTAATRDTSELFDSLKTLQEEALHRISSELREHAETDRKQSLKATEGLRTEMLEIHELCASLSEKVQTSQSVSEWQEKFIAAQTERHTLLRKTDRLKEELTIMNEAAETQRQQQEYLQQELNSLRAKAMAADVSSSLIESLEEEKQKAQSCLHGKETYIHNLEEKLRTVNELLSVQDCRLEDQERQLRGEREKHTKAIASYHEQQDQAVKEAREECTRVRVEYHNIEGRLHDREQECSRLQKEVALVRQRAEGALKNSKDESARQAQEILEPIVDLMDRVSEKLQTSEQAKGDLVARLEAWSQDQAELSLLRQAVQKLATDQQKTVENGKLLGDLLEVQRKLDNTWQWHKSEFEALARVTELEQSATASVDIAGRLAHKGEQRPEILHIANRHVMIQSPAIDDVDVKTAPITAEEERLTRRQAASIKGILKPAVLHNNGRLKAQHDDTILTTIKHTGDSSKGRIEKSEAKPNLVSHSAYNRPVFGSSAKVEGPIDNSAPEDTETAITDMPVSKKRKRAETRSDQRANAVEKMPRQVVRRRAKISDSMSSGFHSPNRQEPATNAVHMQAQPWHLRGGPIEQRQRPFATYGSTSLEHGVHPTLATSSEASRRPSLDNIEFRIPSFNLRS